MTSYKSSKPEKPNPAQIGSEGSSRTKPVTFADLKDAVAAAPDLPRGTRVNILRAVDLVARQMGAAGLAGAVDIARIEKRFRKVTPATLGFSSPKSLSSMMSNFRRALRTAGIEVMPGKSRKPLSPAWAELRERAGPSALWPAVSRFAHWASEHGHAPTDVTDGHVERFLQLVRDTSLKQHADKARRKLVAGWLSAQAKIPGWPSQTLTMPAPGRAVSSPAWSAYPASLEAEAQAFVERGTGTDSWLSLDDDDVRPVEELSPKTRANYLGTLRRAAGEFVAAGVPADQLKGLADLCRPDRVREVLERVGKRLNQRQGSSIGQMAVVLLCAGRAAKLADEDLRRLAHLEKQVRAKRQMGERTHQRLTAMSDDHTLRALINLPARLMREAERRGEVDIRSARLVRCALYLQILLDTGLRSGNVVGLDLERHVVRTTAGGLTVMISGAELKNGQEVVADLRPETVRMLQVYVDRYRCVHAGKAVTSWLFPREDGSNWTTMAANTTLQDVTGKVLGVAVNPHLVRSLILEILERMHPGALALGRDVLGHKSIATTEAHYARRLPARARQRHQCTLDAFVRGGR